MKIKMKTKQVIVIRKDLNMRKGKMVSQGAHASLKAFLDRYIELLSTDENDKPFEKWMNDGLSTKITCGCDSLEELEDLYKKAQALKLPCSMITDAGHTEFGGVPTVTAIAIGPADIKKIDPITKDLKLL